MDVMRSKVWMNGLGGVLALAAGALPFMGLERFVGDARPAILALALVAVAIGCFVLAWRPALLEPYVKLASLAFFVVMLLGVLGLLSEMDASAVQAAAGPAWPTWLGGR